MVAISIIIFLVLSFYFDETRKDAEEMIKHLFLKIVKISKKLFDIFVCFLNNIKNKNND